MNLFLDLKAWIDQSRNAHIDNNNDDNDNNNNLYLKRVTQSNGKELPWGPQ